MSVFSICSSFCYAALSNRFFIVLCFCLFACCLLNCSALSSQGYHTLGQVTKVVEVVETSEKRESPASTFTHCSQPQRTVFSLIANGMDIQHCLCSPLHLLLNHLVLRRVLGLTACVAYPAGLWSSSVASSSDLSSKVEVVIIIDGAEDQHTGC